ncbi:28S ribosomal protein S9, mitochondrial [Orcinus orca]|uniref:Small ribosomal subunit protein uS9m n=1 Tax=Tursiops truncatus TaxID=9739 RepID=A0A2U3UZR3_TURTR|nr:28S ribosomal protein S9, mitochondrial [Orcinus orca]XP_004312628.1 28S ribosomal protein S9, mitochondrial [Tursiops truncatus]XP_030700910.1 small ribosomal subunit protein uS9m [Globicephala melas]XP_059883207.1 small ribosomal subunit protein uS9m [Delphinus delphis]
MAALRVTCGAAASYGLFLGGRVSFARGQGLWKAAAAKLQRSPGCQILRLRHTTVVTTRKNVAVLRRETYTVDFIKKQIEEFNIGKRHLANMMGEDPETFTQEDIDRAIAYLFPSGLFEKRARPVMKHPEEIFPKQRAIQWGEDGRPFHFLFYTGKQSYYSLMHEAYGKLLDVENRQDQLRAKGLFSEKTKAKDPIGSRWLIKEELEEMLVEKLSDQDYAQFIRLLERLSALPCDAAEEEFVGRFRRSVTIQSKKQLIEPLQYDEKGMAFSTGQGNRKTAKAKVTVYDHGSGRIEVNGVDYLLYFPVTQDREQLMFPFHFLDRLGEHDVTCTVSGGGRAAQAGAIRLATARALCSFVTEDEVEWMRQAGLLTADPRVRERKKPGQEGARRKFTWKKR